MKAFATVGIIGLLLAGLLYIVLGSWSPPASTLQIPVPAPVPSDFRIPDTLTEVEKQAIAKSKNLMDIFRIVGVVPLEANGDDFVVYARDAVLLGSSVFVLDDIQNRIYRFQQDGSLNGTIGRVGQGPGEFQRPMMLRKVFDNCLGVYCSGTGKILVYTENGDFLTEYNAAAQPRNPVLGYGFIWKRKDRLIRNGFQLVKGQELSVANVILDPMQQNLIIAGFGTRELLEGDLKDDVQPASYAFEQVGDIIWYGLPFSTDVELYTEDGNFIRKIRHDGPDRLRPTDFRGIHSTKDVRYRTNRKHRCSGLFYTNHLVFVDIEGGDFDVYSRSGDVLCEGISNNRLFASMFTGAGDVVLTFRSHVMQSRELMHFIQESGLEPPVTGDDTMCLFLLEARY